ncbi:Uncharacterised protein [Streptococcus suis]|uniref:Uncharacterized protein n=1 Tax=Streptococcus suis TaxID=1307 RepID=A0A116N7U0_STRSU|nr:Uncharacterised protein [Streptococcus suis]CYV20752.1 Uncharacterised protein [Streptococcus suis]CYV32237.1 Uncharacterised protein [Streptococcus suis]CYV86497.1 Uncharacterised protein [Streptococcus suis]
MTSLDSGWRIWIAYSRFILGIVSLLDWDFNVFRRTIWVVNSHNNHLLACISTCSCCYLGIFRNCNCWLLSTFREVRYSYRSFHCVSLFLCQWCAWRCYRVNRCFSHCWSVLGTVLLLDWHPYCIPRLVWVDNGYCTISCNLEVCSFRECDVRVSIFQGLNNPWFFRLLNRLSLESNRTCRSLRVDSRR